MLFDLIWNLGKNFSGMQRNEFTYITTKNRFEPTRSAYCQLFSLNAQQEFCQQYCFFL